MEIQKTTAFDNIDIKSSSKAEFNWNDKSINWYLDSEKNTDFYKIAADKIYPFVKNFNTLLDVGCGIGSFSIEFAKKGFNVTAIDKSSSVIKVLKNKIQQINQTAIRPFCSSFENFSIVNYDIVFISYMMGLINDNNIDYILQNNKKLILVLPFNKIKNDFSIDELYMRLGIDIINLEQLNYLNIINLLAKRDKSYEIKKIKAEFGQYFYTIVEAEEFIYHYFKIPEEKRKETKRWLVEKLIKLHGGLYLPNMRESVIIII